MKIKVLLLSILLFCFGSPFCMAKTTVLMTPGAHAELDDNVLCTFANSGDTNVDVTISTVNHLGTTVDTQTVTALSKTVVNRVTASTNEIYYCTFAFQGKAKAVRGMMSLSNPNVSARPYATIPAN